MDGFWANVLSSSVALIILFAIMAVIYVIWTQAGLKKKKDYYRGLHTELAPGKRVMFCGGIFGTVEKVGQERVEVQVKDGTVLEVSRYSIQEIVSK